jgi:Transposase and inactivated derivatives
MRTIERISISSADREGLERLVRNRNTPQKVVWRARIVLLASDGLTAEAIAAAVGKSLLTVRRWRRRYVAKGVDGLLKDATRPSRVKPLSPEKIKQVVHMTLHEKPPKATHWSGRSMAAAAGISYSSVQRIWRAHGLKPHLVKTFKVSRDKHFAAKVEDVVGLYLDPPDKALVLCVDEKSQIQALPHPARPAAEEGALRDDDPRLQAKRDHDPVRCIRCAAGPSHWGLSQTTPASGVLEVSSAHRPRVCGSDAAPFGDRQLRYSPHCRGQELAPQASALCYALCAHQLQLAEPH